MFSELAKSYQWFLHLSSQRSGWAWLASLLKTHETEIEASVGPAFNPEALESTHFQAHQAEVGSLQVWE